MFNDKYGLTEAVLKRRKSQTRRIIPNSALAEADDRRVAYYNETFDNVSLEDILLDNGHLSCKKPLHTYDINEVVAVAQSYNDVFHIADADVKPIIDKIDCNNKGWSNKMFVKAELMPHHIRITNIRVERLQDISDADCLKEGIHKVNYDTFVVDGINVYDNEKEDGHYLFDTPREAYGALINKVSVKGTWESNPWVFVYDFELVD